MACANGERAQTGSNTPDGSPFSYSTVVINSPVGAPPPGPLRARVGAVLGSGHKTLGRAFSGSKTERAHLGPRGGRAAGQREPGVRQHRVVNSRVRAQLDPFDVPCEARAFARIECLSPSRVPRNPSRAQPRVLSTHPFGTWSTETKVGSRGSDLVPCAVLRFAGR